MDSLHSPDTGVMLLLDRSLVAFPAILSSVIPSRDMDGLWGQYLVQGTQNRRVSSLSLHGVSPEAWVNSKQRLDGAKRTRA